MTDNKSKDAIQLLKKIIIQIGIVNVISIILSSFLLANEFPVEFEILFLLQLSVILKI